MSNPAPTKFQPGERSSPARWARFLHALRVALRVRRERRLLLGMDERMLKDLGLSGIAHLRRRAVRSGTCRSIGCDAVRMWRVTPSK